MKITAFDHPQWVSWCVPKHLSTILATAAILVSILVREVPGRVIAEIPTLYGDVHGKEMAANCGVNVTAFAFSFFRKPFTLSQVAGKLGVGGDWEQAADMLRIKQVLLGAGLRIKMPHSQTLPVVYQSTRKNRWRLYFSKTTWASASSVITWSSLTGGRRGYS